MDTRHEIRDNYGPDGEPIINPDIGSNDPLATARNVGRFLGALTRYRTRNLIFIALQALTGLTLLFSGLLPAIRAWVDGDLTGALAALGMHGLFVFVGGLIVYQALRNLANRVRKTLDALAPNGLPDHTAHEPYHLSG